MFGFIVTAYTAAKESIKGAAAAFASAVKNAYVKTRNFFFGAPIVKEDATPAVDTKKYGALSNFIDPLALQPLPPTFGPKTLAESQLQLQLELQRTKRNRNVPYRNIPSPFSPETGLFGVRREPIVVSVPATTKPVVNLDVNTKPSTSVSAPVNVMPSRVAAASVSAVSTKAEIITKPTYKPNDTFMPTVSSKKFLDDKTLNELRKKSPPANLVNNPFSEDIEAAPAAKPARKTEVISAPTFESPSGIFNAFKATVTVCDELGVMADKAFAEGKPQQAFNSAVASVSELWKGWSLPSSTPVKPPVRNDGWGADDETMRSGNGRRYLNT
jgi:hypothetical protein